MAVERIDPNNPAPAPAQFGAPPDKYFEGAAEPAPVAPVVEAAPLAPAAPVAETAPVVPAEPAAAPVVDPDSWLGQQTPEVQKYVKDLRNENQNYRQRAQSAESLFEGWHPDDVTFVQDLVRDSIANPERAATNWRHAAEVFGANGEQMPEGIPGEPGEPAATTPPANQAQYLTPADLNRVLDERDQRTKLAQDQERIVAQAGELGYTPGTPDYVTMLHYAVNETGGDLKAAHEKVVAHKQAAVDEYLEQQRVAAGGLPTPTPTGAGPMPTGEPITGLKGARAGMEAYLDSVLGPAPVR